MIAAPPPSTRPVEPPRYRLAIGQELTYASHNDVDYGGSHLTTDSTAVYRVVGRTVDGAGWHVIGVVSAGNASPDLVKFDLWPDGRFGADCGDAGEYFPPLPPAAAATEWDRTTTDDDAKEVFRRAPATRPATLAYTAGLREAERMITGTTFHSDQSRQGTFDLAAGLLVHASRRANKNLGGSACKEDATVDLKGNVSRPAQEAVQFAAQADAYQSAQTAFDTARFGAKGAKDKGAALNRGLEPLLALQRSGTIVDASLRDVLQQNIEADRDLIARDIGILNRPAPAWDLADLAGKHHALADQHGKVVVLDFWYRACPPCVAAMPDLVRLADHYADKPVAFFGMNTDQDAKDAQAIVDRCAVTYPTMRLADGGKPVLKAYQVAGCPTFVVVGPDGVVRHVHVGFYGTTHDEIAREIDGLLATK